MSASISTINSAAHVEATAFTHADLHSLIADVGHVPVLLRSLCVVMRGSRQPMFVLWGGLQQMFYNAAFIAILVDKHPGAFGMPIFSVWPEIAADVGPLVQRGYAGESLHINDLALQMVRNGRMETANFSFSYTPIPGASEAEVLGIFCVCAETTDAVREQKKREAADLRRLRLFENAPGLIAVLRGPNHLFEFANAAYRKSTGDRPLIGLSMLEAFPEVAQQDFIQLLDSVHSSGERFTAHAVPVDLSNGPGGASQRRYVDFVYQPIVEDDGSVGGVFMQGFDTTGTVLAQQRMNETEQRRRQVLDSMGEGFIVLDADFRVLEINAEGLRLDQRSEASILGGLHWELWPASVGTAVERHYRSVMVTRQAVRFQHRYVGDGHDVFLDVRVLPVTGGIAVFYRDVTALAKADTALRQSHERFAAAMQAIGVMWTNGADGRMHGPQPGWQALTGQSEAECAGFGWAHALHPDDAEATIVEWQRAVAERQTFMFEHRVRRFDGQWRRFAIRAVPIFGSSGEIREWVGVHLDITETHEALAEIKAVDRRKDEFLATLAHELRNPLGAIGSAAALLKRTDLPADKLTWLSGVLSRQTHLMTRLLDDLLDVSRFREGGSALEPERVALGALVEAALETVRHAIDGKGHHLDISVPASLLSAPLLFVDPLRTTQVLSNLLVNAAKYTDRGGRIELSARAAERNTVCIEVKDNGIGLAPESLSEIFQVFGQVKKSADRSVGGLGIGLTLARRLVELQGGTLEAHSPGLGSGSTFRVVLPVAEGMQPLHAV